MIVKWICFTFFIIMMGGCVIERVDFDEDAFDNDSPPTRKPHDEQTDTYRQCVRRFSGHVITDPILQDADPEYTVLFSRMHFGTKGSGSRRDGGTVNIGHQRIR